MFSDYIKSWWLPWSIRHWDHALSTVRRAPYL